MSGYDEITMIHYPNIFPFNILIAHENVDTGAECLGTGVIIVLGGHHLIATAAHCIKRNPRIMRESNFFMDKQSTMRSEPPVRILGQWLHPSLDIGLLEVGEALGPEMREDQLYTGNDAAALRAGMLSVVGHPLCRTEVDEARKEITLVKSVFGSSIDDMTDDSLILGYPKTGFRMEGGKWIEEPFIATPHGFSGGGCFGVNASGEVPTIFYKLVGIQSSWHAGERWVKVVPIRHWLDGAKSYLGQREKFGV
jgi:hypothetical protein